MPAHDLFVDQMAMQTEWAAGGKEFCAQTHPDPRKNLNTLNTVVPVDFITFTVSTPSRSIIFRGVVAGEKGLGYPGPEQGERGGWSNPSPTLPDLETGVPLRFSFPGPTIRRDGPDHRLLYLRSEMNTLFRLCGFWGVGEGGHVVQVASSSVHH